MVGAGVLGGPCGLHEQRSGALQQRVQCFLAQCTGLDNHQYSGSSVPVGLWYTVPRINLISISEIIQAFTLGLLHFAAFFGPRLCGPRDLDSGFGL